MVVTVTVVIYLVSSFLTARRKSGFYFKAKVNL